MCCVLVLYVTTNQYMYLTLCAQNTIRTQFYLTQLRTQQQELAYFIGIQAAVQNEGPGQMPSNPGWVYTLGNHI